MMGITKRQSELLEFLRTHFAAHSVSPTLNEISDAMGWRSKTIAHHAIKSLIARGAVRKGPDGRRIELVQPIGDDTRYCFCDGCNRVRVGSHKAFIEALHVSAPILSGSNFKSLGLFDRTCWRIGFPKPAHPETGKTKPYVQPAQVVK